MFNCHFVVYFTAPFTSALINVFGCRKIAMTGGLIASLAFGLSALVPNIDMLILTYGVLGGKTRGSRRYIYVSLYGHDNTEVFILF